MFEITFYAKRISEEEEISYQGFVAGARSKHYTNDLCGANTYYGRFTYDGRVSFEKELFHGHGADAGAREKIIDYQSVHGAPLRHLMQPEAWKSINSIDIQSADALIDVHLDEIKAYLDLLSKE